MKFIKGQLNIEYVANDFREWFGVNEVELIPKETQPILTPEYMTSQEIFDTYKPEDSLGELAYRLKNEDLLKETKMNLFFIKDVSGIVRVVSINLWPGGWYIHATPLDLPNQWKIGTQVFKHE